MTNLDVTIEFTEEVLGTASANPDIHGDFIANQAPDAQSREEEIAAIGVEAAIEKATTIFPKNTDGSPFFWDYQIRGFFKEACSALKPVTGTLSSKIKAHKKTVDNRIFIEPRRIDIDMKGGEIGECQRPIRISSVSGERVSLAHSETIPAGSVISFTVSCFVDDDAAAVKEWLNYGKFKGLGQWRNSGKGRFKVIDIVETVV